MLNNNQERPRIERLPPRATSVIKQIEAVEVQQRAVPPTITPPRVLPATTSESRENRFFTFSKDTHPNVSVTYFPKRNRRLRQAVWVALIVLVLLASATAAAGYLYPNETRDVMRRAQDTIARLFARASGHAMLDREPASSPPESNESKE